MKTTVSYRSVNVLGWHFATGGGASWQPGIIALVKCASNGLRLNFGSRYFVVCWPAKRQVPELKGQQMKTILCAVALCAAALMTGCSSVTPGPGEEAVLVKHPLFFGDGGVDQTPVKTGRAYIAWTTSETMVSTQPFRVDEAFDDLMTKNNNPVDFLAVGNFRVVSTVKLVEKFGVDWYKNNVQRQFQNYIRNECKNYAMNELAVEQTAVNEVEKRVEEKLRQFIKEKGIPVELIEVTIGKVSPQKEVIDAYTQTAVEQQRVKTEGQRKLAEDARREAEISKAKADKAYQNEMGISSEQWVRLQMIEKCGDGCSVLIGAGATPVVNVK